MSITMGKVADVKKKKRTFVVIYKQGYCKRKGGHVLKLPVQFQLFETDCKVVQNGDSGYSGLGVILLLPT